MATQAVLWDLGNVLIDWDPAHLYRKHFSDESDVQAFLSNVCTMVWHAEHDRGVPMAQNRLALIKQYPHHEDAIRAWETGLPDMCQGTVPGTAEIITFLAQAGVPQYALTNLPAEWVDPVFEMFPVMNHMRDVIVSAHEKLIKPDPRIYAVTAERLPHDPAHVVFFDDRLDNVEAARAFGFDAVQFTGETALRAALQSRKLLP